MNTHVIRSLAVVPALLWTAAPSASGAQDHQGLPDGPPLVTIDLTTVEGVHQVQGQWRYSDTRIVEVDFTGPGPDGQPTGAPVTTYDYTPHAGGADYDDAGWEILDPITLNRRRGNGRIWFNWYRIRVTIPERIGLLDPTGTTVVF